MNIRRKGILIAMVIILSICIATTMAGCGLLFGNDEDDNEQKQDKPKDAMSIKGAVASGDWVYILGGASYSDRVLGAKIIGVSSEGKQKEKLIIPLNIDGHKVIGVGIVYDLTSSWQVHKALFFETEKTKKILVPWEIGHYYADNKLLDYSYTQDNFATHSSIKPKVVLMKFGEDIDQYVTGSSDKFIDESQFRVLNRTDETNYMAPNIIFYYNYEEASNNGIYWADDNELDEEIVSPENPVREGYTFDGWYSDESCTVGFNQAKYTEEKPIIKIYAKWTKE